MSTLEPVPYETIRVERDTDGVAVMVINRPEVHNAISRQMVEEMHHALGQLEVDESCRALILTSAGGKAFMSGADIAEMRERRRADALQGINSTLFARFEAFPHPTVAAVVGWCLGGGCELSLTCDFRVAGASARFGQPEVGLGIMAAAGATRRLPALVGLRHARRLLFSGAIIDAQAAADIGLHDQKGGHDEQDEQHAEAEAVTERHHRGLQELRLTGGFEQQRGKPDHRRRGREENRPQPVGHGVDDRGNEGASGRIFVHGTDENDGVVDDDARHADEAHDREHRQRQVPDCMTVDRADEAEGDDRHDNDGACPAREYPGKDDIDSHECRGEAGGRLA